ncbi:MAG: tRNA pseudouridine(38-40) synthase TruA [Planctomycetota bacterium]
MTRTIRIDLSYDGSGFVGWQRQSNGLGVQETVENVLSTVCNSSRIVVEAASRTDTGVHARRQVASARVDTRMDDATLATAMNVLLPDSVHILSVETVAHDFHARFWARGKRYIYRVESARFRSPFETHYASWVRAPLDLLAMRAGAKHLIGRHDFVAFANSKIEVENTVRTIEYIHIFRRRNIYQFGIQGNAFLYNQVRSMVGTLVLVGKRKIAPEDVANILASRDRRLAGPTMPPEGLILARVLISSAATRAPYI